MGRLGIIYPSYKDIGSDMIYIYIDVEKVFEYIDVEKVFSKKKGFDLT